MTTEHIHCYCLLDTAGANCCSCGQVVVKESTGTILTPEQVRLVRRYTSVPQQAALCDSHEALREQLAAAQSSASIRVNKALSIVNEHLSSDPTVAALQEQLATAMETLGRLQPMPPYDACSPLHDHERIDYNGEEQDGS